MKQVLSHIWHGVAKGLKWALALLWAMSAVSLSANKLDTDYDCTPTVWSATATWYDNGPLGLSACHFSDPTLPGGTTKATQYYAAVATHMYDDNLCGACAEITETSSGQKVTVMITDECPAASNPTHCSTGSNHLDISQNAFDDLEPLGTGVFNMTWKIVTCPNNFLNVKGQNGANMTYQFKSGASSGWATLIVRDYPMPIKTLEYCTGLGTGCSAAAWQRAYNGWVPSGSWNTIYLRITDKGGNVGNFGPISCCSPMGTDAKGETASVYGNVPAPNMPGCSVNSPTRTNTPGPSATNTPNWSKTPTPSSTPTPSFLSKMIYDGETANTNFAGEGAPAQYTYTFQGAGTASAIADQNTTLYAGSNSGRARVATTSSGYAGAGWQFSPAAGDPRSINSSSYTAVEFYIRGAVGAEKVGLRFGDDAGTNESPTINISSYLAGGITTGWQLVSIPLSAFDIGASGAAAWKTAIGRMVITADGGSGAPGSFDYTVYIDNVMFTLRPASPTPSFSPSFTRSNTPTATPSRSATPTYTNSAVASPTQTATGTRSATPTFTGSPTRSGTPTFSPVNSATATRSATLTFTGSPTRSGTPTFSPVNSATSSATPSATRSSTPTFSYSPTTASTFTASNSATPTGTRSATPSASASASPSRTRSATPSISPTFTNVPAGSTATPTGTQTATLTRSSTPTLASTATQSATRSATATLASTGTPSATRTPTLASSPSNTPGPSATFTLASSPSFTALPSASATLVSSPTFTLLPSATSTLANSPTVSPTYTNVPAGSSFTVTPSISPSPSRTATATLASTFSATRSATPTLASTFSATRSATPTLVSTSSPTATLASTGSATATSVSSATPTLNSTASSTTVSSPTQSPTTVVVSSATASPTAQPLQPTINSVSQPWGLEAGGETVTIQGSNFEAGATVRFGANNASNVVWISSSTLTVSAPAGSLGVVSVSIDNPSGGSVTLAAAYEYKPAPTPSGDGPNEIEDAKAAPNPCFGVNCVLAAKLKGRADRVTLRVFSKAYVLVGERELGPQSAGWVVIPMPASVASQSMGMYFYVIDSERNGKASGKAAKGSFWLQR